MQQKTKKASRLTEADTSSSSKPQLSRREREELERQRAKAHYQKLHAEGKTEEARADLARLAIIRKQREEAAKKREEEKKGKGKNLLFTISSSCIVDDIITALLWLLSHSLCPCPLSAKEDAAKAKHENTQKALGKKK